MYKEKYPRIYPVVSFFGIHLFPTIVVYLCMLPFVFLYYKGVEFSPLMIIGFVISISAFILQMISDIEMHLFRKKRTHTLINVGLWKYSRHPNYLGEILMWWMVSLFSIFALGNFYFLVAGAVVNTFLFVFISIPLAERHQRDRKPNFDEYKRETRMLLPIYKRVKENDQFEERL